MDEWMLQIRDLLTAYGLKLLAALIILLLGRAAAKIARKLLTNAMQRAKVDETLVAFTCSVAYVALMVFVGIAALETLGFPTTSFAAVLAAAGLAVGLAMQGSLSNFASGVLMILFKPFAKGHFIEAGGTAGVVEEIGIFHTVMKTPDNRRIIVPNASITEGTITNNSINPVRRIDLVVGVGYGDDVDKVKRVLEEIVSADDRVLPEPEPFIALTDLADSSVNFAVRPWVNATDWWATRCDLTREIKKRFDREGITIPFPQREVWLHRKE